MSCRAVVTGVGKGIPHRVLTNADIEKLVDTSDDWIIQRTGIKERRIVSEGESTRTLSLTAAKEALEMSGVQPTDLDMVVVGTVTPDYLFPAVACQIQGDLGATKAGAFDVSAACAGFIYSVACASAMIECGTVRNALVVGVDTLTNLVDWTDRSTCVLFGDGAGAVVLERKENTDRGVMKTVLMADGRGAKHIMLESGGSLYPATNAEAFDSHRKTIYMSGAEVYRFAVTAMGDACCRVLDQAGMTADDIDLFVPHQANLRIIESAAGRLKLPPEKVFVNVHKYGNTSGGSIPIALAEAVTEGRLEPGMIVMTVGFGAGLVWGANLIRW